MEESNTITPAPENKKSFNPVFWVLGVFALGVVGLIIFNVMKSKAPATSSLGSNQIEGANTAANAISSGPVKEFTIDGSNYAFNPSTITVNKGDTVKITFKDDDGRHNLVVDGYNVSTNVISQGSQDTITFVADKTGSFEYYCSVGEHRDLGMTGTLVVQ